MTIPYVADVLRFVNLFSAAIGAGGLAMVLVALVPAKRHLATGPAVDLHQYTTPLIDRYMPQSIAISLLSALLLLIVDFRGLRPATVATVIGAACTLGVSIVSVRFNFPINRTIAKWSVEAVPAEYPTLRQRWDRLHLIRTAFAVVALACYIIGAIAS